MAKLIFVNLPVADLPRAVALRSRRRGEEPAFSDDTAACMVFSETIHAMLLTHDKFRHSPPRRSPTPGPPARCCSASRPTAAPRWTARSQAGGAGGGVDPGLKQDHGFMYGRSFEDPDGHIWEVMWMDLEAAKAAMAKG